MKQNLYLLLAFLLVSCGSQEVKKKPVETEVLNPIEVTVPAEEVKPEAPVVVPGGTETEVIETVKTPEGPIKIEVVPTQEKKEITFSVKSSLSWMKGVATIAECVIHNEKFLAEVAAHKQFFDTKDSSKKVSENMRRYRPVILTTYKKNLSSTLAYRNVGSNILYFNLGTNKKLQRLNPRTAREMLNTAIHEWLHVQGYGHSVQYTSNRPKSVPYAVGDLAEKYTAGCNSTKTK